MLHIAIILLVVSAVLWIALFIALRINPKAKSKFEVGGGEAPYMSESWSPQEELQTLNSMSNQDVKLLENIYNAGSISSLDELELLTKESTQVLANRLRKLEELGLIVMTNAGHYEVTEYGRKILERYREKLALKKREEELLES